jgi:hypothetical protein
MNVSRILEILDEHAINGYAPEFWDKADKESDLRLAAAQIEVEVHDEVEEAHRIGVASLRATVETLRGALEMSLKAFEAVSAGFHDGSIKWAKKRVMDSDPYHPANTLMCKAEELARAALKEGK